MRRAGYALSLMTLAVVLALGAYPSVAETPTSGEVDVVMTVGTTDEVSLLGTFSITGHIIFSGEKARITEKFQMGGAQEAREADELSRLLGNFEITTIFDGSSGIAYVLDPASKTAMKLSISEVSFVRSGDIANPLDVLDPKAYPEGTNIKKVGRRTHRGKSYARYLISYNVQGIHGTTEALVDENELPVLIEGTILGTTFSAEYKNYRFHKVDAGVFRVPIDYEIVEMSSVVKEMEEGIIKAGETIK